MMAGLPGTGKSTLAGVIGEKLAWPVLDKDLLNAILLENSHIPQAQAGPLAYELVLGLTRELVVQQGHSIILDTAGRQVFIAKRVSSIAQEARAILKLVYCQAPQAVRRACLATRVSGPSQLTTDHTTVEQEQAWYAHLPAGHLILNTDQPFEATITQLLLFIHAE